MCILKACRAGEKELEKEKQKTKKQKGDIPGMPGSNGSIFKSTTWGRGLTLSFQTLLPLDQGSITCDSTEIRISLQAAEQEDC